MCIILIKLNINYINNVCVLVTRVQLFVTPWVVARQAPLSMEFSSKSNWCGLPFPSPRDLHLIKHKKYT